MNKKEIITKFKNIDIHKILETILDDVTNFEFEKRHSTLRGFSINVWRIKPMQDEGSYLYYDDEESRDYDWDLLMGLIELEELD